MDRLRQLALLSAASRRTVAERDLAERPTHPRPPELDEAAASDEP